jgi:rSAM/selenodomain-associated transferase 1
MESSLRSVEPALKSDCVLVVMAKAPRPGTVKTRLIRSLPLQAVTSFYRCLLDDTLALARSLTGVEVAIMCPASDVDELAVVAGSGVKVVAQNGEGLAAGLTSVFAHFAEYQQRRIIAFNSDSPHLSPSFLEAAFETLAAYDLVVGPTYDGGYYLVGANGAHPSLFIRDGMGTGSALENLLSQARGLELSVGFTDPFYDIDVADDLIQLAGELEDSPGKAPRTALWLKEWGDAMTRLRTGTAD